MSKVGPFFKVGKYFIYNAIDESKAETRDNKKDNPFSHEELFAKYFRDGDYINYPRGRVVFDTVNNISIIYIDKCINKPKVIERIVKGFEIKDYRTEYDLHYHCRKCIIEIEKEW